MKDSKDSFKKKWGTLQNLKIKNHHLYEKVKSEEGISLSNMFISQLKIQAIIQDNHKVITLSPDNIKSHALSIIMETAEVLDRLPFTFKYWKDYTDEQKINMIKDIDVAEEVIDIFHFLMNLWMSLGLDYCDFYVMYMLKSKTNLERQKEIRDVRIQKSREMDK